MHIWGGLKQPDNALDKWLQLFMATLVLAVMLGHNFHIFEAHLAISARARCYFSERISLSPREHRALSVSLSLSLSVGAHFTFSVKALRSLSKRIHCVWESTLNLLRFGRVIGMPCSVGASERVSSLEPLEFWPRYWPALLCWSERASFEPCTS